MTGVAAVLVAVPFVAAGLGLAVGRARPALVPVVALAGAAVAVLLALVLAVRALAGPGLSTRTYAEVVTGGPAAQVALLVDGLAAALAVAVSVVALLVQVFSVGYLRGDPRYSSYAALVSLFTAAMLLVVVAGDLLVLFVGWEVMGVCSYFLVGHHWELREARAAAVKAFLVTRVGDVLLLFGIFALAVEAGSFGVVEVLAAAEPSTVVLLLVVAGALSKSAQFPLHVWLPPAMAGPTPVSALIHAATMVAAGVFLLVRLWPLLAPDATVLLVLAVVSAVTMTGAALAALVQDDLKRVLAWSTVSQLALMFAALAVSAPLAATFHLLTHAAFKALLFLSAGAVMHSVGTSLMRDMGGLRRAMPVTAGAMAVGLLALAGVPPLSGALSKESVLAAAEEAALHGDRGTSALAAWVVLVAGLLTVALTAAYCARLWLRAFAGPPRGTVLAHEPHRTMQVPLLVLVVPTALLGVLALPGLLPAWVEPFAAAPAGATAGTAEEATLAPTVLTLVLSLALVLLGAGAVLALWRRDPAGDPAERLGRARPLLAGGFGLDAAYERLVVRPVGGLALLVTALDRDVVDAYVRGSGRAAWLAGGALRRAQAGSITRSLTLLLAGAVLLVVAGAVGA